MKTSSRHHRMSGLAIWTIAGFLCHSPLRGATPMDAPVAEGKVTEIECEYALDEKVLLDRLDNRADKGVYHYTVYVPPGYSQNPERRYPCLFIFSPGGNAQLGAVKDYAAKREWVVVMLKESRNGPIGPGQGNFLAAHDDVVKRLRIQEGLKVVTGLSGGARGCAGIVGARPGFAGIILQGAGFNYYQNGKYHLTSLKEHKDLRVYALFGETDSNTIEIPRLEKRLPNYTKFKVELFKGGHEWAPADSMERALDWVVADAKPLTPAKPRGTRVPFSSVRPARTWTSTQGTTIEASLLSSEPGHASLKTADGRTLRVPIAGLSTADAAYIDTQLPQ